MRIWFDMTARMRRIQPHRILLLGILLLAATCANAVALPNAAPVVPKKNAPYDSGKGYWVYVCNAASKAGYSGNLNKAFEPYVIDRDQWLSDENAKKIREGKKWREVTLEDAERGAPRTADSMLPTPARYDIDMSTPERPVFTKVNVGTSARAWDPLKAKQLWTSEWGTEAPDLNNHLTMWDDCHNGGNSLGVERKTAGKVPGLRRFRGFKLFNGDPDFPLAFGDIGAGWNLQIPKGDGLAISKFHVDDTIRSVRTTQPDCDRGGTNYNPDIGVWCPDLNGGRAAPGWGAGWSVKRASTQGDDKSVDQIRFCQPQGTWRDGRIANAIWKNISLGPSGKTSLWNDSNFSTTDYGSPGPGGKGVKPYYRRPNQDGSAGDYFGMMHATKSDVTNPDATCQIASDDAGPAREWYFSDPDDDAVRLNVLVSCYRSLPSEAACHSLNAGTWNDEAPKAEANFRSHGVRARVRGATVFVSDTQNPTVAITGGEMNAAGKVANDGTVDSELLTFSASDNAGIRQVIVELVRLGDGHRVLDDRVRLNYTTDGDVCDYRYPVPCAGATAGGRQPAWVQSSWDNMFAPYALNVDDLNPGQYHVEVTAVDASNNRSTATAAFTVSGNLHTTCDGNIVPINSVPVTCGTAALPTPSFALVGGAPVVNTPDPKTGSGVISYTLATNSSSNGTNPLDGSCRVIEHVISGSDGVELNDREKNQIISMTIDLSGYATRGTAGGAIGTQDLRTTFEFPGRRDSRYRAALGCSG